MKNSPWARWIGLAGLGTVMLAAASLTAAEGKPDVFQATASFTTAGGAKVTSPVVVTITRWTTDAERDKAHAALRSGGSAAFHKVVAAMPEIGTMQVGAIKTPLRYARTLPVSSGAVVTAITGAAMYHIGAGVPDAKPKEGYDLAVAIFEVDAAGKGPYGDFAPGAKVKVDDKGAIVIEDYGAPSVQLSDIAKK
jgi:hypothetical protein